MKSARLFGPCFGLGKRGIIGYPALSCLPPLGLLMFILLLGQSLRAADAMVSRVRVAQVPGTLGIVLLYDLEVSVFGLAFVRIHVSTDGGRSYAEAKHGLSGDVGNSVAPGVDHRVVWTAEDDWLGRETIDLRFRVEAGPWSPDMIWIPAGSFTMGSPEGEVGRASDEGPATVVRLSRGFWMSKHEVTQKEWEAVMGTNSSHFKDDPKLPVEHVSWEEAMEYCRRLTQQERKAGRLPETGWEYQLPTEAQWEYACRAGTRTATAYGDSLSSSQANFDGNQPYNGAAKGPYLQKTVRVGGYAPNGWGFHDMHGNVWEWCADWYSEGLPGGSVVDAEGPKSGLSRVIRGGGWFRGGRDCRSAFRAGVRPGSRFSFLGFRSILVIVP